MRNKFVLRLIVLIALAPLTFLQVQCRHDGLDVNTMEKVCYQRDIAPIFLNSCGTTGCHDGKGEGDFVATDYTSVMKGITPFNAQKSKVYQAITGKAFVQLMPPSGALTENERILIRVWIDQGAVKSTCIQN